MRHEGWESAFYAQLGRNIRTFRDDAGITQMHLAAALGVSRASIANIEAGRQRLAVHQLVRVAEEVRASVASLIPIEFVRQTDAERTRHQSLIEQVLLAARSDYEPT